MTRQRIVAEVGVDIHILKAQREVELATGEIARLREMDSVQVDYLGRQALLLADAAREFARLVRGGGNPRLSVVKPR
jgi:hypothetical protein